MSPWERQRQKEWLKENANTATNAKAILQSWNVFHFGSLNQELLWHTDVNGISFAFANILKIASLTGRTRKETH